MKHIDLFSGIGGFALATEMVWPEVEHIFCDNEPYAQEILKKHWPQAPIIGDIRSFTHAESIKQQQLAIQREQDEKATILGGNSEGSSVTNASSKQSGRQKLGRVSSDFTAGVDLLTGGFPCQPFSAAGRRLGTEDDRHLWPEMLRVIREFHPRWIIGENVGGLVTWSGGMVLEQIHLDLEAEGYEVQAFIIPAAGLNAPHRRDRVWIVARNSTDSTSQRLQGLGNEVQRQGTQPNDKQLNGRSGGRATANTQSVRERGRDNKKRRVQERKLESIKQERGEARNKSEGRAGWDRSWVEVAASLCRVDDGVSRRLDRTPRLKGLGNAIVPQVAAQIMMAIKETDYGN